MYRVYLISQDEKLDRHVHHVVVTAAGLQWEGAYPCFADVFELVLDASPNHVLLVDADELPPEELKAICRFHSAHPSVRCLPLLRPDVADLVQVTARNDKMLGVSRYADARGLLAAIGAATNGGVAGTSGAPAAEQPLRRGPARRNLLTRREMEVLQRLSMGEAQKQIAERLGLSHHTVDNHVRSIYRKLQARSAVDAVAKGFRRGILF